MGKPKVEGNVVYNQ